MAVASPGPALLFLCTMAVKADFGIWIKSVDKLDSQTLEFNCSDYPEYPLPIGDEDPLPKDPKVDSWLLPGFNSINGDYDEGRVSLLNDAWVLRITNVTKADFGVYYCIVTNDTGEEYLIKWGVNMMGPYFEDMWDKYKWNVIVGSSAAGIVLCVLMYACFVINFRYRSRGDEKEERSTDIYPSPPHNNKDSDATHGNGEVNPAFDNSDGNVSSINASIPPPPPVSPPPPSLYPTIHADDTQRPSSSVAAAVVVPREESAPPSPRPDYESRRVLSITPQQQPQELSPQELLMQQVKEAGGTPTHKRKSMHSESERNVNMSVYGNDTDNFLETKM